MAKNSLLTPLSYWSVAVITWLCTLGLLGTPIALAQSESGAINIEPAFQEVVLTEHTASSSAELKLTNDSDRPQVFELSLIEIQQFDDQGRVVLADKPFSLEAVAVPGYVSLNQVELTVEAHQSVTIPITVSNLSSLSPGGHYVAVLSRLKATSLGEPTVLPAVSSFLLIRKQGGELFHLNLIATTIENNVWWWRFPEKVMLTFSNQGNTHLVPRGSVILKDIFNRELARAPINENSLYVFPGTQREITTHLKKTLSSWPLSLIKVEITGTSQPGSVQYQHQQTILYTHPLFLLVILLLLVLALVLKFKKS